MDPALLTNLLGNIPALGFVFWLVHRNTTHTIPRLAKENNDSQERLQAAFLEAQAQGREDFREILAEQREAFQREMAREREIHGQHVEQTIRAIRDLKE